MLSKRLTFPTLALTLLAVSLAGSLREAELGEVKVNSHIGQQLSADIELVDLTPADLADLQARLANPDVFKGANLAMPPVLGGMYISVARRENKRFLHLTTLQPVNADVLHLFLELSNGGRSSIRAASLWLTPEPVAQRQARSMAVPAAAPMPLPAAPAAVPTSAPAAAAGDAGLSEAAQRAFAHRKEVAQAQAQDATPSAASAPTAAAPAAAASAIGRAPARTRPLAETPATPKTPAKPMAAEATQSCAPAKEVEAQAQQCQAMTSKLADIEGKVQRLQKALAAPVAPAAAIAAAPSVAAHGEPTAEPAPAKPGAAPAKPGAAPTKPGAAPVKPGVAADLAGKPKTRLMTLIAGALAGLAAVGGLVYFLRKRQSKGPLKIWQSFRKKDNAEPAEPVLEDVVEVAAQ